MAGLAIVLDLLRKNSATNTPQSLHCYGAFSAAAAAAGTPFAFRAFLGYVLMVFTFLEFGFFAIEKIGFFKKKKKNSLLSAGFFFGLDSFVEICSFEEVQIYSWAIYCHGCKI